MEFTREQRIFVVINYLGTKSFKEVHQLFEQRFRDIASPTNITIWKNVKMYKTRGSSLNMNKDNSGGRRRTQENINLQENLIEVQEYPCDISMKELFGH